MTCQARHRYLQCGHLTDKGQESRIYEPLQIKEKKTNDPMKKNGQRHGQGLDGVIQMSNEHLIRCSTSLGTREMQSQTIKRYYLCIRVLQRNTANRMYISIERDLFSGIGSLAYGSWQVRCLWGGLAYCRPGQELMLQVRPEELTLQRKSEGQMAGKLLA